MQLASLYLVSPARCSHLRNNLCSASLCSVAAEVFAHLRASICRYGLSLALPELPSGEGKEMRQSSSQNHKKLDYLIPRRAPETLAIRIFKGRGQAEYPKQTSPTKRSQTGDPNREVLSQRSETKHAKQICWSNRGVNSKNWFLCLFHCIHGDTSLDRTCKQILRRPQQKERTPNTYEQA